MLFRCMRGFFQGQAAYKWGSGARCTVARNQGNPSVAPGFIRSKQFTYGSSRDNCSISSASSPDGNDVNWSKNARVQNNYAEYRRAALELSLRSGEGLPFITTEMLEMFRWLARDDAYRNADVWDNLDTSLLEGIRTAPFLTLLAHGDFTPTNLSAIKDRALEELERRMGSPSVLEQDE